MAEKKKVTIELTPDQTATLKEAWGVEVNELTYDHLEQRFAPSMPSSVMRKLDALGRGDLISRGLNDGGLE